MKVNFNIQFHTVWGQTLHIIGSIPELGEWNTPAAREMQYTGEGYWTLELDLPDVPVSFEYRYFMSSNNKLVFEEWQKNHLLSLTETRLSYVLLDYWQNHPQNRAFYSSAFSKSLFAHPCDKFERVVKSSRKVQMKVLAPRILKHQSLALVGNQKEFGYWDPKNALILACEKFPEWRVEFDATQLSYPIEYKFCVLDNEDKSIIRWENGDNRILNLPPLKDNEFGIISGLQFRDDTPDWKCTGLVVPVFSLRSNHSFGIGDLNDLHLVVNWAKMTSQKIIQILPVNDTTVTHSWLDSYPYNAISIYALHPLYLNLQRMGKLKDDSRDKYYTEKQRELNSLDVVDYESVDRIKWSFFRELFDQEGDNILSSQEFIDFFQENKEWLVPYAAYSYQRDKYQTPDFRQWKEYNSYNKYEIEQFCQPEKPHYKSIALYYFLQFHLHRQLIDVRNYAYANGIVLKGDIPIGISKSSVEAWTEPSYFNMDAQAGAPPDDFSATGQNWGFPTYNWENMEADHYTWWKKRFRKMSDYFDAYRIDHILGFFRIWEIPEKSVQGLSGYFNPSLPFNIQEIENAGLPFSRERFTTPHINEQFLPELFGEYTQEVRDVFLDRTSSRHFALKTNYNTQRKIQAYFTGLEDEKSKIIKKGLFSIANEVLFIPDPKLHDHFHPRISASVSYLYHELSNSDRYAFDYLYWNYFYQRHNEFWKEQGYKRLTPLISCTDMLVCGEDLGMIPQSVPEVMHKLQILSLEIERMPKESNVEFTDLHKLPYLSVCTTSTHDMSTIRSWWEENQEKTQRYYNFILKQEGPAPQECDPKTCEQILFNHLTAPSMLAIIPLQDWLSIDGNIRRKNCEEERINIPSNPRHYWRYRMHICLEELLQAEELNEKIRFLIEQSKRN